MDLLIHDLSPEEWEKEAGKYEGWNIVSDDGSIRPCVGCFRCWTGGTGSCAFKDGYENMGALIHGADSVTVLSRYTYGGFSSFVKNVFDRSIGYVLPEFETAYGEMHHKRRYPEEKPATFIFRGSGLTEEDKEKAKSYVAAVCRNLRGTVKEVLFEETGPADGGAPEGAEKCEEGAAASGAEKGAVKCPKNPRPEEPRCAGERSGVLLIDCSPRGKRSNTGRFLSKLSESLGAPAEMISLAQENGAEKAAEALGRAKTAVLGVPLYVDGLPSPAIRFMERVKELGTGEDCELYALVNNGLYESSQNANLLNMIKDFCADCGLDFRGSLAIGAGEVAGMLIKNGKKGLWPARNAEKGLALLAKAVSEDCEAGETFADLYMFPRWLYIAIANLNWQRQKKAVKS